MNKELSAGIIFLNKDKTKIFMGRATNVHPEKWDIPKGHVEPGEGLYTAAIRECLEETSFVVNKEDLEDLGHFEYSSNKDLHLFKYKGEALPDHETAICTAMFELPWGDAYPEFDKFAWVDLDELHYRTGRSLGKVLGTVLKQEIFDYYWSITKPIARPIGQPIDPDSCFGCAI